MSASRPIEATILGQSYVLACPPDGEQRLLQAVAMVDREMSAIRDAGRVKARERMAVLAALNLAYQRVGAAADAAAAPPAAAPPAPPTEGAAGAAGAAGANWAGGAAGSRGDGPAGAAADDTARIAQLVARIDAVLGEDGRLF